MQHCRIRRRARRTMWWLNRLNLKILEKNAPSRDPQGADFDYRVVFNSLDLAEVKKDIEFFRVTVVENER